MDTRVKTVGTAKLVWPLVLGLGLTVLLLWALMPHPAVEAQGVNPGFTVDIFHDRVWGMVNPGDVVTFTGPGQIYGAAQADAAGFFWTPLWDGATGAITEVNDGAALTFYVNGSADATITARDVTGQVDVLNDRVTGNIPGVSTGTAVTVTLKQWIGGEPQPGAPQATATTDSSGNFTATFGSVDIAPNYWATVDYAAGSSVRDHLAPAGVFMVYSTWGGVYGFADPGQVVTTTVYTGTSTSVRTVVTGTTDKLNGDYWIGAGPQPGDLVEVDLGGGSIISTVVATLTANVDATTDLVTGTAPANADVRVTFWRWTDDEYRYFEVITTANGSGVYTADLSSVVDVWPSDWLFIATADSEGDETWVIAGAPFIQVFDRSSNNQVRGRVDGPNLPVTATVNTGVSTSTLTGTSNPGAGISFDFNSVENIFAGYTVTVESPTWVDSMTVASVLLDFDVDNDRVIGYADNGRAEVEVGQRESGSYPINGSAVQTATITGPFTVTFSDFDLRFGSWIDFRHFNGDGYQTVAHRDLPYVDVGMPHGVGGNAFAYNEAVTATLYYSDGATSKAWTANDKDGDPFRFWFDEWGGEQIEPGDWVTVVGASGWAAGVQTVDLSVDADETTDRMWGQAPVGLLYAQWDSYPVPGGRDEFVPTDGAGNYLIDWSAYGDDIQYGNNLRSYYTALNGNQVSRNFLWPWMRVNYSDDRVEGDYEAGHTFWITVTDGVASTAVLSTTPGGGWGGPGFGTEDSDWPSGRPDIQPGDQVAFQSDDGYSNLITVGTITGNLDIAADTISGSIQAPFGAQTMTVECHIWVQSGPNPISVGGVAANGGSYTCDFSGTWDILPGHSVAVMYIEPDDGDRVINVFREPAPNLWVNKQSQGDPAAGGNFVYQIEYQNGGEGEAANVVLTDTLPLSTTYVSDSSDVTAHVNGRVITWSLPTIPAQSDNYHFDLVVAVDPLLVSGTLHNEVEIYAPYDEDPGNNSASTDDAVQSSNVDLSVEKWNHHSNPAPGYDFVYLLRYRNDGSTGSGIVTLTDTLPLSATYVSWFPQDPLWNLVSVGSQVVFTRPVIAGDRNGDIYLTLHLSNTVQEGTTLTNVVSIATTNEGSTGNNVYTHTMEAQGPYLDIGVSKDFGYGSTVAGYDVVYYINYMNHSNTPAYGVLITDTLPSNTTFVTSTIQRWQYGDWQQVPFPPASVNSDRVVWDLGTLDVAEESNYGEYGQIYVTLHISSGVSAGTVLTNAVEIASTGASPESDDNPENDSDEAAITVRNAGANLMVLKNGNWQGGPPWQLEYDLQYYNVGTTRIEGFTITDTYPLSTTFDQGDVWWGGPITFTDNYTDNQAIWEVGEGLNAGDSGGGRLVVNVDSSIERGRLLTNVIEIAGTQTEVETADNTYTLVKTTGPDLYVVKAAPSPWVEAGETLTFTLRYGNQAERGEDRTDDSGTVYITDTLPAGMEYVTSTMRWCGGPQCPYVTPNIVGDDLIFDVGPHGDGQWNEIYLTVQVTDTALGGDSFPNQVEIASSNPVSDVEPYTSNNTDTETLTLYDPLFAVGKVYEGDVAGQVVTYTLTVTNTGPEAGTNVLLSDTLPANLTYGGSDGVWTGTAITWSLSVAASGGTATGWFTATLPITDGLTITNDTYYVVSSDQGVSSPMGAAVSFEVQPDKKYVYLPLVMRNYP